MRSKTPTTFTTWSNPTTNQVKFDLLVAEARPRAFGAPVDDWDPQEIRKVDLAPGAEISLPSEFDHAIQQTRCRECSDRQLYCREVAHRREVVGGLAPDLRRGDASFPMHPSLARANAAKVDAIGIDDADARILAKAAGK